MQSDRGNVVHLPSQQPAIEPFDVQYISELQGRTPEPINYVVDGCIPRGEVTIFAGDSDIGKSYLAQQLLTAVALGKDWLGRHVEQCRTFGLFAEDRKGVLHIRQEKISAHYGVEHADLEMEACWQSRYGGNATLMTFGKFDAIGAPSLYWSQQLVPFLLEIGARLVIIDTAARTFRGNENDRNQVTSFLEMLTRLAAQIDGAVVLTMHPPKDGMQWYSGSGAWKASARSAMSLERPKGYDEETQARADERVLRVRKGNYSGSRPFIPLRFQDGVFVAEEVTPRKQSLTVQEKHDLDYRMLAALKRLCNNGAKIPADPQAIGSLPRRAKASTPEFREWPLVWLADSVDRIIDAGMVVRVEVASRVCIRPSEANAIPGEREWKVI